MIKTFKKPPPKRRNRPIAEVEVEQKRKRQPLKVGKIGFRIRGILLYPLIIISGISLLAMVNGYQENLPLRDIHVTINSGSDNDFMDVQKVKEILGMDGESELVGLKMSSIELSDLEKKIKANPFIKEAEVFKSVRGVLFVDVEIRKPIARLINNSGDYVYVDGEGNKFPSSDLHTAHVTLVRGDFDETVVDTFACSTIKEAIPVLKYIYEDPFWNAQISDVVIKQSGELVLYPQIGSMFVEFGQPIRIADKFENMRDFYRQVVKEVGWDKYRSISVKYKGQVVAKKR